MNLLTGKYAGYYGYEVDEKRARDTLNTIFDGPVNFLDTSNNYGFGRSEERIGDAPGSEGAYLRALWHITKLDRDMDSGSFDASRARNQMEKA